MLDAVSWQAASGLHLAAQPLHALSAAPAIPPSAHRIFVCDVSGSMWNDLPKAREHLKRNLTTTIRDGDTVTIVWFSGRGQFGVLLEGAAIQGVTDLSAVHGAIDRWLQPVGMTGFKEPLEEVLRVIGRLRSRDADAAYTLAFLSDGHDNQWPQKDILGLCGRLSELVASAVVIEYGWYANRPLLTRMAEELGGSYAFAEDFGKFAPVLDGEFSRQVGGARKREIQLAAAPRHGLAFAIRSGSLCVFAADGAGKVRVPEDVRTLFFFTDAPVPGFRHVSGPETAAAIRHEALASGAPSGRDGGPVQALYAGLTVLSQRMQADDVFGVLKALGDARLIRQFTNCFGKQSYSAFQEAAADAAADPALRWADGYDPALVPSENAYTVLDLLADLMQEDGNLLHIAHPAFAYQRISRKTEDATGRLTADERAEIAALAAGVKSGADAERVQQRLAEIAASKPKPVTFRSAVREKGVPLASVTLNETRPNVSVLTQQEGMVELGADAPHGLPPVLSSRIFRNYTVIRDGILNVKTLPVSLAEPSYRRLEAEGLVSGGWDPARVYEIGLGALPIINRRMVRSVSARDAFTRAYGLAKARAAQKVFSHYEQQHFPKERAAGLRATWGDEAAEWLKSVGVTDGGFSPKVTRTEASDVYVGRELKISLKGLSSLPKVEDVAAKLGSGKKLTAGDALMAPFVREVAGFMESPIHTGAADPEALLKTWLCGKARHWAGQAHFANRALSEIKFSVCVGQVWFSEFGSLDEGTLPIEADGAEVVGTAVLREIEVDI